MRVSRQVPHGAGSPVSLRTSNAPAVLIRAMDGRIALWSPAMAQRYGFTSDQARGQVVHQLLETIFWKKLDEMESFLLDQRWWSGGLIHHRSDGCRVMTAHFWHLHLDVTGGESVVTELHSDILPAGDSVGNQLADVLAIVAREVSQPMTAIGDNINAAHRMVQLAWPDQQRLTEALSASAEQLDRVKQGMVAFRAAGEALRPPRERP